MSSLVTQALRRSLQPAASCSRYSSVRASSSSSVSTSNSEPTSSRQKLDIKPQSKLPDEKMRVLVRLYHQSESFITKENLSARIDEAFIRRSGNNISVLGPETPFFALERQLEQQRSLPKFGVGNEAVAQGDQAMWSDMRPVRERTVSSTLFGTDGYRRPGYDVLKEEKERVKRELEEGQEDS
ncbi:hypothetical protein BN946_scf185043.g78 [Trametes cinnabarina]|uniref:Uncharacterized protein n=1 Tax=Pycnoporus cinnabarinus TaxID=5643 RepID=A0A060SNK8_PYCCI|nr:hypothetical protein BN946_scf185043.g78 [Trametes cinnabarina]